MKFRSFSWRIAVLTALLSGIVMVLYAGASRAMLYRHLIQGQDHELELRARALGRFRQFRNDQTQLDHFFESQRKRRPAAEYAVFSREKGTVTFKTMEWPETFVLEPYIKPFLKDRPINRKRPLREDDSAEVRKPRQEINRRKRVANRNSDLVFFTLQDQSGRYWRLGSKGNERDTYFLAMPMDSVYQDMAKFGNALLLGMPFALLLITAGSWWVARRSLKPVKMLTKSAEQVTARGLDQRIEGDATYTEFQQLIRVYNAMLDRLEMSFKQALRFSADAAHELNTPLTVLQGELEQMINAQETGSELQQTYSGLLEEVQSLHTMMRKLLLLSRADAGNLPLQTRQFNFKALVEDLIEDTQCVAEDLDIDFKLPQEMTLCGDKDMLRQVLRNLLSNAVKYNHAAGWIRIELVNQGDTARFVIANSGALIPEEEKASVFERFYRADKVRSRDNGVEGSGLGLSLARELVSAHSGTLRLIEVDDAAAAFELVLPIQAP